MKFKLIFFWITILSLSVNAQLEPIRVLANIKKDKIQLRWGPTNYEYWTLGNKMGYKVEKFVISTNGVFDENSFKKPIVLIESSKPLPVDQWEEVIKKEPNAQIVKSLMYSAPVLPAVSPTKDVKAFLEYTKMQNNRFGFALFACDMSTVTAAAHGLYFEDTKVVAGEKYAYRISIKTKIGTKDTMFSTSILVGLEDYFELPKPRDVKIENRGTNAVIGWNVEYDKGLYTGYFIEKSSDGVNFVKVNESPYVQMKTEVNTESKRFYFEDSLQNPTLTYSYRVIGMTPFAEFSPASDIVKAKSKVELKVMIGIDTSGVTANNRCMMKWNVQGLEIAKLKEFNILRSKSDDGIYEKIGTVSKDTRTYTDPSPLRTNYYLIQAMGESGETSHSLSIMILPIDSTPPAIPSELKAIVEPNGTVILTWKPNTEEDIMGYRVYRSNGLNEVPVEFTKTLLDANLFIDTLKLNILSKNLYYRVTAVDMNFNPSDYSKTLLVKRPDTIKPAMANITQTKLDKYKVSLKWQKSYSMDVEKYFLYRMNIVDMKKELLDSFAVADSLFAYIDSTYDIGSKYRYCVDVQDDSRNISTALSGIVSTEIGIRRPIEIWKAKLDNEQRKVKLTWTYEGKEKVTSFVIYRQKNKEAMSALQSFGPTIFTYDDKLLELENEYTYCIKANLEKDLDTELSKKIKINY
jgi:uncharacterized protein